ncbi:MAG: GNAT family N-acetyltransferase [Kiloniellales bacterium]|nr:GNAT family N-acetyltransferase [Kiloniellales bacterium]
MTAQHVSTATRADLCPGSTEALGRPARETVIRALRTSDLPAIEAHLLALGRSDRASRFHALLGDDAVQAYVGRIDFARMILIGAFDRETEQLVGLAEAHLDAAISPLRAEVSVSVLADHRGRGLGRLLTAVALDDAAARGTRRADFYFQAGNRAVARLVGDLGAPIATAPGFASLALPLGGPRLH